MTRVIDGFAVPEDYEYFGCIYVAIAEQIALLNVAWHKEEAEMLRIAFSRLLPLMLACEDQRRKDAEGQRK